MLLKVVSLFKSQWARNILRHLIRNSPRAHKFNCFSKNYPLDFICNCPFELIFKNYIMRRESK